MQANLRSEEKTMAPDVGFEPTTKRLTAAYSTAELIWNKEAIIHKILGVCQVLF